jgi:hypothetical protein
VRHFIGAVSRRFDQPPIGESLLLEFVERLVSAGIVQLAGRIGRAAELGEQFVLISRQSDRKIAVVRADDHGHHCPPPRRESTNAARMARGDKRTLVFDTLSVCSATGILLENGGRYAITIKAKEALW